MYTILTQREMRYNKNMNEIIKYIFLFIILIIMLLEVFFCFINNKKYKAIFKCFPLLLISIFALCLNYKEFYIFSIIAFLYSLGDLFLLSGNKIMFTIGAFSFFSGHLILIIQEYNKFNISINTLYFSFIPLIIALIFIFIFLYKMLGKLFIVGASMYLGILVIGMYSLIISKYNNYDFNSILIILGFYIYLISDVLVILKRFGNLKKKNDFYIMSTYYLANALLFSVFLFN